MTGLKVQYSVAWSHLYPSLLSWALYLVPLFSRTVSLPVARRLAPSHLFLALNCSSILSAHCLLQPQDNHGPVCSHQCCYLFYAVSAPFNCPLQYVVETRFVGEREQGVAGADIVDVKERVVDVAAPGPTCPVNTGEIHTWRPAAIAAGPLRMATCIECSHSCSCNHYALRVTLAWGTCRHKLWQAVWPAQLVHKLALPALMPPQAALWAVLAASCSKRCCSPTRSCSHIYNITFLTHGASTT